MIAQPHRRALITVPPALVPTLGAMLRPTLATILAMIATVLAAILAMVTRLGLTLALRPLGTLRPLFATMAAMLMRAIFPPGALATFFSAMPALLGAP